MLPNAHLNVSMLRIASLAALPQGDKDEPAEESALVETKIHTQPKIYIHNPTYMPNAFFIFSPSVRF